MVRSRVQAEWNTSLVNKDLQPLIDEFRAKGIIDGLTAGKWHNAYDSYIGPTAASKPCIAKCYKQSEPMDSDIRLMIDLFQYRYKSLVEVFEKAEFRVGPRELVNF